jgi:V/A-type H+-transporting ATPase subunit A
VGGFGEGKTMLLEQLVKWGDADVIIYVGCGERGNELADLIGELRNLEDPRTGQSVADRTVIIANTSNMPVMARETSIYTAATVAEYFRDMGYAAVVIADSTSRWAEALRELSSRTGVIPAEEGYPPELPAALAAFYARAGRVRTLGSLDASVTIVTSVSPPGGDLTEPVTSHTERFVQAVWVLDRDLAYARHYPAVSWRGSSSRDADATAAWFADHGDPDWAVQRARLLSVLAEADRIESVAELVGVSALPAAERMVLLAARLIRDGVLQQSAMSDNDAHCSPPKQTSLCRVVLEIHEATTDLAANGVPASVLEDFDYAPFLRAKDDTAPDGAAAVDQIGVELLVGLGALRK